MKKKNIFVVGLEPFNLALLRALAEAHNYRFHDLLSYDEVVRPKSGEIHLTQLLKLAEQRLNAFSGSIDAIIGYWDFPASVIIPILCNSYGLPAPALEAVAMCEHKFWARERQKRTLPDLVPRYCAVNPFDANPISKVDLPYPFWIKPIKAHSSYLGFKIHSDADFQDAIPIIRANIGHFGKPFDEFLAMIDVPQNIARVGGHWCIAEEIISAGKQCTLEGYVYNRETVVYGVVDSIRSGKHRSSFARYQYPSKLPAEVRKRMIAAARKFMAQIDYDNAPFNMEFYWNPREDTIKVLEINTRISKSHCPLFMMVDGSSHQKVPIDIALGRKPDLPHREGDHRVAAKFMLRLFEDGIVEAVPRENDIRKLKEIYPDALIRLLAKQGRRLAHLPYQDSYSFEIAELFLGAESQSALLEKYRTAQDLLPFKFVPTKSSHEVR